MPDADAHSFVGLDDPGNKTPTPPVRTVDLIDDDRRVPPSLANLLASGGYGTRAYECALDFVQRCSGLVCVITDLGMRPIDGIQVLDRTVYSDATTHVIGGRHYHRQTGREYRRLPSAARRTGFLQKAVVGDALLDLLDSIA
jgi:CheY-like chemotaxis protein